MNTSELTNKFYDLQSRLSAYRHAVDLIYYDGATTAPKESAENRAHALGILCEESYKLSTGDEMLTLIEGLAKVRNELSQKDRRCLELAEKEINEMKKIPLDEYVAYEELIVAAEDTWHSAKENDDFASFLPYLEKIFAAKKRFAELCAPDMKPYDYWLGQFEDGLTTEKCDTFFEALKAKLVPLIESIGKATQNDDSCLHGDFSDEKQLAFSHKLMEIMGIDRNRCILGTTEHPFTTSIGSHKDVRITTNFKNDNFASSMFSVIHEGGHALYDMNSTDELAYTYLDGGVSMGIHESQSRFYENLIGRSEAFINYVFPVLCKAFPEEMSGHTADEVYKAVNLVTPSLIRTEADEVTYCLHVMIRYELERAVMEDRLEAKDLSTEWKRLYKEYLGVDVPNDRMGVLQDSHWSGGMIGYFPSYALGSAYGAHILKKMRADIDVDACIAKGDFTPINEWNRNKIWRHGCMMKSDELLESVLGESFDPVHYTDYLEEKYKKIYNLV